MPTLTPRPDDVPCDFIAFLRQRLDLEAEQAADLVARWLLRYEPMTSGHLRRPLGERL